MRAVVNYYSRDSVSAKEFENEFLEGIVSEIKIIASESNDLVDVIVNVDKLLSEIEWNTGRGYNIAGGKIIIYDKNIKEGVSLGYDKVEIRFVDDNAEKSSLIQRLKLIRNKINNNDKYYVYGNLFYNEEYEYIATNIIENLNDIGKYEGIYLSGKNVKKLIDRWLEYVITKDKDYPGYAWGLEVRMMPTSSYNWVGERWNFEVNEKLLRIVVISSDVSVLNFKKV